MRLFTRYLPALRGAQFKPLPHRADQTILFSADERSLFLFEKTDLNELLIIPDEELKSLEFQSKCQNSKLSEYNAT